MDFLAELARRDLIQDQSPGLAEHLSQDAPVVAYIGFDPTAPSLTIGNYVPIMLLKLFQLSGHRPIMLFGGATGRIGDPSGKSAERTLKPLDEIAENLERQRQQAELLLEPTDGLHPVQFVDNYEFYRDFKAIDFLREVGKTVTVSYMLAKESVRKRLDTGLSFTEFSYQLLQGYDFQCLHERYGCTLQMGGSDQWGNITTGTEFVRRNTQGKAYGLTAPLLTKADGTKFGKTESGNVWLDADRTSAYEFFQFWINAADADLERYIKTFSLGSTEEHEVLLKLAGTDVRRAKAQLAEEMTTRIHGAEAYEAAQSASAFLFDRRAGRNRLEALSAAGVQGLVKELGEDTVPTLQLAGEGMSVVDLLSETTDLARSKSEARRAIQQGSLSINRERVNDLEATVTRDSLVHERYLLIELGKQRKRFVRVTTE